MATILELDLAQKLSKLDPGLEAGEREWRWIYGFPQFRARVQNDLPTWKSEWKIEESPNQQFDSLADVFCSGATLTFGNEFHILSPAEKGIWELKTADLRIFGWFWKKDWFIATNLMHASYVKTHDLYHGLVGEAVRLRDTLDLTEPKFVAGEDPNVVVSNYNYP
jgi:hypothetical protein